MSASDESPSARSFERWRKCLYVATLGAAAFGAVLALFDTRLLPPFAAAMNSALWDSQEMPANVVTYHRFVHGVVGAVIASWGVTLSFVVRHPFRAR